MNAPALAWINLREKRARVMHGIGYERVPAITYFSEQSLDGLQGVLFPDSEKPKPRPFVRLFARTFAGLGPLLRAAKR